MMRRAAAIRVLCAAGVCVVPGCSDDTEGPRRDAGGGGREDAGTAADAGEDEDAAGEPTISFFVSSDTHPNGNLGGLEGADARCQRLAEAVGAGNRTWRAYLSAENNGNPIHARDRIGTGPWHNAKGELLAEDLDALHAREGDAELFLDETGAKVNGQWAGSPSPNEHDILTGSDATGQLIPGKTCADWTSTDAAPNARVGHSDGLGPNQNGLPPYNSWQSSHENVSCSTTTPLGGAGKIYCFAAD
jgi:hypothetical protein